MVRMRGQNKIKKGINKLDTEVGRIHYMEEFYERE